MAKVIDYEYVKDISIEDVMNALASDNTHGANQPLPGVNTFKIDGNNIYNLPEGGGGEGIAGWNTDVQWSSDATNLSWTAGDVYLPDGTALNIESGSIAITANTYLYCDTTNGDVYSTTSALEAVGENKLMICVAFPSATGKRVSFQAFGCGDQSSMVTGDNIANGTITGGNIATGTITATQIAGKTITASEIAANTITAGLIASNTITANQIASNTITGTEIKSGSITASKMDVSQLSAISANLGTITAGDITGTTVTAGSTSSAAIKLNPSSSSIDIYYNGMRVGQIKGVSASSLGSVIGIIGNNVYFDGTIWCAGKLRVPVGTDLY